MSRKLWSVLFAVGVLAQIALVFVPFVPFLKDFVPPTPSARDQLLTTIGFLAANVGLAALWVGSLLALHQIELKEVKAAVDRVDPLRRTRRLRDDEFYRHFMDHAKSARNSVCISYLSPKAPSDTADRERKKYYRDMTVLIKQHRAVRFRRLIRGSTGNGMWIAGHLKDLEGCPNADVAIMPDVLASREDSLALSVQVIDDQQTWLVALDSHERRGAYRDLYIEDHEIAEDIGRYYERLWRLSEVLLDCGRLTDSGKRFLEPKA